MLAVSESGISAQENDSNSTKNTSALLRLLRSVPYTARENKLRSMVPLLCCVFTYPLIRRRRAKTDSFFNKSFL